MPSTVPSRYEPTGSDWDEFDYFCQSPYLLSVSEPPPRERFKRRLFRRSQKYSDPPSTGAPSSQRHLEQQTSHSSEERLRYAHVGLLLQIIAFCNDTQELTIEMV
ncbi:hypothetical protein HPB48_019065 [Haemaphysalis longicornis]|uniref:Uncharacterized protein n=1 Tax=Haemaphysalis longicornis TaxID=44386 RepID=A0A9J6GVR7_HAELO|nr:hypothetical protein HPB48_019065 [Haemaphysalis longicornis]